MKNIKIIIVLFTAFAALNLMSCGGDEPDPKDEPKPAKLTIEAVVSDGVADHMINEVFKDQEGINVKILILKFYLANISITTNDGFVLHLSEMELLDFKPFDENINTPQWRNEKTYEIPVGGYSSISFGVGVPAELNDEDPATFPNQDPLSVYSNMYWNWASMYRFIILEAEMDTIGDGDFDHDLIFHTGLDDLYRKDVQFDIDLNAKADKAYTLTLKIDWNTLFYNESNPIAIKKEHITHTTETDDDFDLAKRFT
ncbi:MAG: MbnP family protein, partial [Salibacteraceae bacterium]